MRRFGKTVFVACLGAGPLAAQISDSGLWQLHAGQFHAGQFHAGQFHAGQFHAGSRLALPYPDRGTDRTGDAPRELGCAAYHNCK